MWQALRMDETDRAIIAQLRENGRISNTDLADRVGLTAAPCLRRVRRLEDEGVITGYHARISPQALGRGYEVFVHIELERKDRETTLAFESQVLQFPEVIELRRMFGAIDYVMRVATSDVESFEEFWIDRLQAVPGSMRVESLLTMKVLRRDLG
jgi:DNA-binding Lrp family transcriptional regulator